MMILKLVEREIADDNIKGREREMMISRGERER